VEGVDVTDQADDRADDASADERRASHALDLRDDVGDVALGGLRGHDDDHGGSFSRFTTRVLPLVWVDPGPAEDLPT
jgi:hypothetical protein